MSGCGFANTPKRGHAENLSICRLNLPRSHVIRTAKQGATIFVSNLETKWDHFYARTQTCDAGKEAPIGGNLCIGRE